MRYCTKKIFICVFAVINASPILGNVLVSITCVLFKDLIKRPEIDRLQAKKVQNNKTAESYRKFWDKMVLGSS